MSTPRSLPPRPTDRAQEHPVRGVSRGQPDWLYNRLTVSGPAGEVARFREAAHGTGAVPWYLDLDAVERRLLAPMASAGAEAQTLARLLRAVIARRHERVLAHWHDRTRAVDGGCALDLHRLLPVPADVLQLGEDAPAAQAWLWANWGTLWPLRRAALRDAHPDRRLRRSARLQYEFWSADWTPWQAVRRLCDEWPSLVLCVIPLYDGG